MRHILPVSILLTLLVLPIHSSTAQESIQPAEPQITIRHDNDETFYEYRINGILKEIKVIPKIGPSYYLIPSDGSKFIREDQSQLLVPSWVLFKW